VQSLGPSAQGATLSFSTDYIFYVAANNNNDTFTYTVSNGGGTATGTISVNVAATRSMAKSITVSGSTATLKFLGIPGSKYDVQRTTSLNEPVTWATVTTSPLSAGPDGSFTFVDTGATDRSAYYRSVQR
jgi:hypothetical protein